MSSNKLFSFLILIVILSVLITACGTPVGTEALVVYPSSLVTTPVVKDIDVPEEVYTATFGETFPPAGAPDEETLDDIKDATGLDVSNVSFLGESYTDLTLGPDEVLVLSFLEGSSELMIAVTDLTSIPSCIPVGLEGVGYLVSEATAEEAIDYTFAFSYGTMPADLWQTITGLVCN